MSQVDEGLGGAMARTWRRLKRKNKMALYGLPMAMVGGALAAPGQEFAKDVYNNNIRPALYGKDSVKPGDPTKPDVGTAGAPAPSPTVKGSGSGGSGLKVTPVNAAKGQFQVGDSYVQVKWGTGGQVTVTVDGSGGQAAADAVVAARFGGKGQLTGGNGRNSFVYSVK